MAERFGFQVGTGINLERITSRIERCDSRLHDLERALSAAAGKITALQIIVSDLAGRDISEARLTGRSWNDEMLK